MIFKVKGTYERDIWKGGDSTLVVLKEQIPGKDQTKSWSIWIKQQLAIGQEYVIEGIVSEAPNKGFVDQNGKQAYKAVFNATSIKQDDDIPF